jgi:hypothetical protein
MHPRVADVDLAFLADHVFTFEGGFILTRAMDEPATCPPNSPTCTTTCNCSSDSLPGSPDAGSARPSPRTPDPAQHRGTLASEPNRTTDAVRPGMYWDEAHRSLRKRRDDRFARTEAGM